MQELNLTTPNPAPCRPRSLLIDESASGLTISWQAGTDERGDRRLYLFSVLADGTLNFMRWAIEGEVRIRLEDAITAPPIHRASRTLGRKSSNYYCRPLVAQRSH